MIQSKGVSPLIASIILVAFVVAVAAIASTFFIGFTKTQTEQAEEKGKITAECSVATMDVVNLRSFNDTAASQNNLRLSVQNTGRSDLKDVRLVAFNSTGAFTFIPPVTTIRIGEIVTLQNTSSSGISPYPPAGYTRITVTTNCPGASITVENTTGDWKQVT